MITSSSIPYISQVLKEPQNISEADAESIADMTQSYPYFAAARYLDAAYRHQQAPYNESLMTDMRLYTGNWLLYSEFLQKAYGEEEPEMTIGKQQPEPQTTTEATTTNDTIEEVAPVTQQQPTTVTDNDDFQPGNTDFVTGDMPIITEEEEVVVEEERPIAVAPTPEPEEEDELILPEPQLQVTDVPHEDEDKPELRSRIEIENDETLILPVYTEDYFMHQGVNVSNQIPEDMDTPPIIENEDKDDERSLMVVMSFSEWLNFFKTRQKRAEEEEEGQKAIKAMWQKEKLAAALEEEDDEIPESVFEMAVNSITKEEGLVSESLANVHIKQGRYDKAIEMYRKLSLRNPQKKAYFARKIELLLKEKNS